MSNTSSDIKDWKNRIAHQVKYGWDNYICREIDLNRPRTDELWDMAGEMVGIIHETEIAASSLIWIKLDRPSNDWIPLQRSQIIRTVFSRFWIRNTAVPNTIFLIVGCNFDYITR